VTVVFRGNSVADNTVETTIKSMTEHLPLKISW